MLFSTIRLDSAWEHCRRQNATCYSQDAFLPVARTGSDDSRQSGERNSMTPFELPKAPAHQNGAVKAWSAPVVIPTYHPLPPDKNPMFLEKRVYQGSSGRVYPLPFTDRISTEAREHSWQAVHLENEFIRVMVLPR